ncbi:MAG: protein translocase subunit SecD [Planctomycetota bacterium]
MVGIYSAMLWAAEGTVQELSQLSAAIYALAIIGGIFILPFVLGSALAKWLRMPDYGWKIGAILASIIASAVVLAPKPEYLGVGWPPKLGIDLKGGVILVYEVNVSGRSTVQATAGDESRSINMNDLVVALGRRINPGGTKEIVIRPFGSNQVEIIIPDVDPLEVERIKKSISTAGMLEFRIVANLRDHEMLLEAARQQAQDPLLKRDRNVKDATGKIVGFWARVAREEEKVGGRQPFKVNVWRNTIRDSLTGNLIQLDQLTKLNQYDEKPDLFVRDLEKMGITDIDVLMYSDDKLNVVGKDLGSVTSGFQNLSPKVDFSTKDADAARRLRALTSSNLPQDGFSRSLGIVLDGALLSAPAIRDVISERGQITGNFTQAEVDFLVTILRAGQLPAALNEEPVSENQIGSLLGSDMILKSASAITVSMFAVVAFVLVYYRFSGLIACTALLLNLVLTVAIMVLIKAPFTLPGLAGLVLTVGMSVDANVLIYERMREEQDKGAALRMIIRNGFDRAFVTILDSNLTTVLTAVILYLIGTDQVRGFAITLTLGIVTSMFTAIFCSRVAFEICERRRWMTQLKMMRALTTTHIDFMGIWKPATLLSVVLILIGLGATFLRGSSMLDVDFLGGTSIQPLFTSEVPANELRAKLDQAFAGEKIQYTLTNVEVGNDAYRNRIWKLDTSVEKIAKLEERLKDVFPAGAKDGLATYVMNYSNLRAVNLDGKPVDVAPAGSESVPPGKPAPEAGAEQAPEKKSGACQDSAAAEEKPAAEAKPAAEEKPAAEAKEVTEEKPAAGEKPAAEEKPATAVVLTEAMLEFKEGINQATLEDRIRTSAVAAGVPEPAQVILSPEGGGLSDPGAKRFPVWKLRMTSPPSEAEKILAAVKQSLAVTPVYLSASEIGGQVAGDTKQRAVLALLLSLIGIVLYIWFRFQNVVWGLAAVLALVHDVLMMLGALAVSRWLAGVLGFAMIDEFKINLTVVAAFLTLVGYSINDTIVVFDRIREVRGKSPKLTADMINLSVNQTLSRTILTALTVFLVVTILYFFGGDSIHAFAFALVVGTIVGSYSSIFIAAPVLLTMASSSENKS